MREPRDDRPPSQSDISGQFTNGIAVELGWAVSKALVVPIEGSAKKMSLHAIYSSGGFAREVKRSLLQQAPSADVVFVDDDEDLWGSCINGSRVVSFDELSKTEGAVVSVALADPSLRRQKVFQCKEAGIELYSIVSPTCVLGENVRIGPGAILAEYSMVTADAHIGQGFHANIYSYVAHDCRLGDFVTLAPRVSLNGRIVVEDGVYIGSDATFLPGRRDRYLTIGKDSVVGAGAVVTKDVQPGTTVVGSPARPLS